MIAEKRAEEKVNQARKRKFYYALIYISKFYFNAELMLYSTNVFFPSVKRWSNVFLYLDQLFFNLI